MTTEDNTLGELNMVPVAGEPGPTDTVALETAETEAPKKKAGRPSNAEKAGRAAAPQAEARTASGPVEPAPA